MASERFIVYDQGQPGFIADRHQREVHVDDTPVMRRVGRLETDELTFRRRAHGGAEPLPPRQSFGEVDAVRLMFDAGSAALAQKKDE